MYCPIFRGKQFELIALRELVRSEFVNANNFRPIIEPVRSNLAPLKKTLLELNRESITPILIINPSVGELKGQTDLILSEIIDDDELSVDPCIIVGGADGEMLEKFPNRELSILTLGGIDKDFIALSKRAKYTIVDFTKVSPAAFLQLKNAIIFGDFFQKKIVT